MIRVRTLRRKGRGSKPALQGSTVLGQSSVPPSLASSSPTSSSTSSSGTGGRGHGKGAGAAASAQRARVQGARPPDQFRDLAGRRPSPLRSVAGVPLPTDYNGPVSAIPSRPVAQTRQCATQGPDHRPPSRAQSAAAARSASAGPPARAEACSRDSLGFGKAPPEPAPAPPRLRRRARAPPSRTQAEALGQHGGHGRAEPARPPARGLLGELGPAPLGVARLRFLGRENGRSPLAARCSVAPRPHMSAAVPTGPSSNRSALLRGHVRVGPRWSPELGRFVRRTGRC